MPRGQLNAISAAQKTCIMFRFTILHRGGFQFRRHGRDPTLMVPCRKFETLYDMLYICHRAFKYMKGHADATGRNLLEKFLDSSFTYHVENPIIH